MWIDSDDLQSTVLLPSPTQPPPFAMSIPLDEREAFLRVRQEQLDRKDADLGRKQRAIAELADSLAKRLEAVQTRERIVTSREDAVSARELLNVQPELRLM